MTDMFNIIFDTFCIWLQGYMIEFSCLYLPQGLYFISTLWLWWVQMNSYVNKMSKSHLFRKKLLWNPTHTTIKFLRTLGGRSSTNKSLKLVIITRSHSITISYLSFNIRKLWHWNAFRVKWTSLLALRLLDAI